MILSDGYVAEVQAAWSGAEDPRRKTCPGNWDRQRRVRGVRSDCDVTAGAFRGCRCELDVDDYALPRRQGHRRTDGCRRKSSTGGGDLRNSYARSGVGHGRGKGLILTDGYIAEVQAACSRAQLTCRNACSRYRDRQRRIRSIRCNGHIPTDTSCARGCELHSEGCTLSGGKSERRCDSAQCKPGTTDGSLRNRDARAASVADCRGKRLIASKVTFPRPRLVGLEPKVPTGTAVPVPESEIVTDGFEAFDVMVTLPLVLPVLVGANFTVRQRYFARR